VDDAPFGPVMGTRGEAGAAAGTVAKGAGSSSSGATMVATSAAEPLCQGGQGAGRSIAEGAQRRQQRGQEDMNPLIGFPLPHAEQASLDHLECVGLQIDQHKQEPLLGCREWTIPDSPGFSGKISTH